ncbi:MAG: hypothetical protein WAN73_00230 [Methyloceanibacter sp.]|jgi:hypothetical protein
MAQLVVLICLLSTPTDCSEKPVPGATAPDVVSCLKTAGDKADEWQKANSQYFVIGWRCEKQKG